MTVKETIERLTNLGYFLGTFAHFYEKTNPGKVCNRWDDIAAIDAAISELKKQASTKSQVKTNIYDTEEIHHNCTVQILTNSVTGDVSVGWWKENTDEI